MSIKLKDKKIVICKKVKYEDEDGFQTEGYMPIHPTPTVWAYFKQLSASLLYTNNSTFTDETCFFRVNWLDYLRTAYTNEICVYYRGIVYQATRIDPFEDYTRDLAIYCKQTTDRQQNLLEYDPKKL